MRYKKSKLTTLFLLGLGLTGLQAQDLYVNERSSTQTIYTLSNLRKMTFSGGNAHIQKNDNSTAFYALSELSYISFTNLVTGKTEHIGLEKNTLLTVYPNPVNDVLSIDLSNLRNKVGTLRVLSLEGHTMITQQIQGGETEIVNLSALTNGIYFCQFSNENEMKTIKIIKD